MRSIPLEILADIPPPPSFGEAVAIMAGSLLLGAVVYLIVSVGLRSLFRGRGISRRVPWRMRGLPYLHWSKRTFIGVSVGWLPRVHVWASASDAVGIVGPPRSGKTSGFLIPQLRAWDGAAVSASTKDDVLRATLARRLELARAHGGRIWIYAPTAEGQICGIEPMDWSPLTGGEDPTICQARVRSQVQSVRPEKGMQNGGHWIESASSLLCGLYMAAALDKKQPGDMALVLKWLDDQDAATAVETLRKLPREQGGAWADSLDKLATGDGLNASEAKSFWSTARSAVAGLRNPMVLARTKSGGFDPAEFIRTRSTLFVIAPSQDQETIAPLISALIESISQYALKEASAGRHHEPLLLNLDEVANIAPLPSLSTLASQGGGQGITLVWALQNFGQLRERYGVHAAAAIQDATTVKVVTGGLTDVDDLDRISRLCGEVEAKGRAKRRLGADELRQLGPHKALMLARHHKPILIKLPRWWRSPSLLWAPTEQIGRMASRGRRQAVQALDGLGRRLPQRRHLPALGAAASGQEEPEIAD